jgi:N-ethylmaleimide reductase
MLFDAFNARSLHLANRIVMAPMTRSRATTGHTPDALMATYYGQRATAGLIITEGTSPSANGLGYPRIPGLYNAQQVDAWQATTAAVHAKGGKIFVQLMHCGRVAHVANLPAGAEVLGPGAAVCPGEMYTDTLGMQPHSPPRAMREADIAIAVKAYVASARFALDAGFDGVELHAANGYLIEQFLNPIVNLRTDGYGGSIDGRIRLALEIARGTVAAIGRDRVGIRLSPYGVFNGTGEFPDVQAQYLTLARSLSTLGLLYVHLVDHAAMGAPPVPADFKLELRAAFDGLFILSGGFDAASAEQALRDSWLRVSDSSRAVLIRAMWLRACGKLPCRWPVRGSNSSDSRPTSLRKASSRSNSASASAWRPVTAMQSASQKLQGRNTPSPGGKPSTAVAVSTA